MTWYRSFLILSSSWKPRTLNSQLAQEEIEPVPAECLCKDTCELQACWEMSGNDDSRLDMFPYKVTVNLYVLNPLVKYGIGGNVRGCLVVTI